MPMPSSAFVMSPWADLTLSGNTIVDRQDVDPILQGRGVSVCESVTTWPVVIRSEPFISPVFADLRGLTPLLIQAGSHEILLSDAVRLVGTGSKRRRGSHA